jgi:simple sugar transport system substrate-binding protein
MVANTSGPINYVEFRGSTGAAPAIERHNGFHNVIDSEKRFTLLDSQDGDFTLAGGKKLMTNWITRFGPKIDMIFAHNDAMAEGAQQALKEAGFTKKLYVGSIDGERKAIEQVAAGNFSVCVQCDPHYGKRTFDAIDQYFAGAKLPPLITVADKTFTKENAGQLVAEGF